MIKFLLWLSRLYHEYKDANTPHVKIRDDWEYDKGGDNRRDI